MSICCVCGYEESKGVIINNHGKKGFACLRCFWNPHLFFAERRLIPADWVVKKVSRKRAKVFSDWGQRLLFPFSV